MGSEQEQNSAKGELPLATRPVQPKKACWFACHRRTIGVSVLIGVALWFVHKRYTFAPELWSEDRFALLGYHKSDTLTGREAEELFL